MHRRRLHRKGAHRLGDVFEVTQTEVRNAAMHAIDQLITHFGGYHRAAGLRQGGQACRKVDTCAIGLVLVEQHFADVDANSQDHGFVDGPGLVAVGQGVVQRQGQANGASTSLALDQQTVPCSTHHPRSPGQDHVFTNLSSEAAPAVDGVSLVILHQSHRLDEIGKHDGAPLPAHQSRVPRFDA